MVDKIFLNYTILYVEDDTQMRSSYSNYFESLFKTVYQAQDGVEALNLYKKHFPDILLADISMPNMDGLTLTQKIREHDSDIKIILLTAHADKEKLLKAVKLNLVDYLLKPIKRAALFKVLQNAIKSNLDESLKKKPVKLKDDYVWYDDTLTLYYHNKVVHLTNKEKILLKILSSNINSYFSIENIIDEFYINFNEIEMSKDAVRGLIKRLKNKLPKDSIDNDFGVGYKLLIIDL